MRNRKRQQRPSPQEASASGPPSGLFRHRWCTAIGVLVVAVALAIFADWRMSGWSESPLTPETVELSASDGAAAPVDDAAPNGEAIFSSSQNHVELMAAMTRLAQRVVTTFPEDPTGYDLQGRVYAYLGKSVEATGAWERCRELDPDRPDACNGLATLAIRQGDDAAAEPLLRRAIELHAAFPEANCQLADLLTRNGRVEEARAVLQRYVQQVPTAADGMLRLAQAQLQLTLWDEARQSFEAVIKLLPTSSEAHVGLGTALTRLGQREEARKHLEKSRELRAQKPPAPPDLTAEAFDILQSRVNCSSSVLYAARIYQSHGHLQVAAQLGRQAVALDPKNLPGRLFLIAVYQEMGQLADAIQVCQDTVAADPQNPDLVWQLGILYTSAGRFDAAETALKQVIQLVPEQASGYAGLAQLYLVSRRGGDQAVRLARAAVRLKPVAVHYELLGRCYAQVGDFEQARAALDEAVKCEPDNALYRQLRDELQGP